MSSERPDARGATSIDGVALFHRTLAELCRADVPLSRALDVAQAEAGTRTLKDAAARMAADVEGGESLGAAYARHARGVPDFYARLVAAGENTGDVPAALEQIAAHAAHHADVHARLRGAFTYPLTTALFVLLLGGGILSFAAPRLWTLTASVSDYSPWPLALGTLGALAALVVGVLWFARRRRKGGGGLWLPVVGPLRLTAARATLASTLALLLRRGTPLPEALREAAATCENDEIGRRVESMAAHAEGGGGLTDAVRAGDVFEPSLLWLVEMGERGGEAADALEDVARIQRERLSRGLDRCTVLVRPALELAVGAAVFVFAYAFVVPLFDYAHDLLWR